ncbi:MAG: serine/threonine protein kinase, partial [Pirellulales bacterium]|nr:serine/threonine protein kinase [Pirellulales bacterium]
MTDDSGHELIDELADEFLTSCLRGMRPKINDYCEAYPWLADEIRQLFPMLSFLESNKDQRDSFQTPEIIGSYRILREIGRGGMGFVYEARHDLTDAKVALKILAPADNLDGSSAISRFEREAQAVSKIDHPHVVRLIEFGEQDGLRFIAMQLIDGSSLDRVIRLLACAHRSNSGGWFESVMRHLTDGQSSFATSDYFAWVTDVGLRTARALHYAHQSGILHRDVKPSNLLVDRTGKTWLTDFGLAKTGDTKLTRTGQVIGTLRYLAPERLHG